MIIRVASDAIVIQPVHWNRYVTHTPVPVYARRTSTDLDAIDALTGLLLCCRTIPRVVPTVTVLVQPRNAIRAYSIIGSFEICQIGL